MIIYIYDSNDNRIISRKQYSKVLWNMKTATSSEGPYLSESGDRFCEPDRKGRGSWNPCPWVAEHPRLWVAHAVVNEPNQACVTLMLRVRVEAEPACHRDKTYHTIYHVCMVLTTLNEYSALCSLKVILYFGNYFHKGPPYGSTPGKNWKDIKSIKNGKDNLRISLLLYHSTRFEHRSAKLTVWAN